jgi:hypothetical protein
MVSGALLPVTDIAYTAYVVQNANMTFSLHLSGIIFKANIHSKQVLPSKAHMSIWCTIYFEIYICVRCFFFFVCSLIDFNDE